MTYALIHTMMAMMEMLKPGQLAMTHAHGETGRLLG
jgi:gentisate 1,2-dioxygenase